MRSFVIPVLVFFLTVMITSCGDKEEQNKPEVQSGEQTAGTVHTVAVEEKVDASSYSYLKVSENNNSYWIAVPRMEVKSGDVLVYSKFMEMKDFRSETLNKTFESVLFVDDARIKGNEKDVVSPHSNISTTKDPSIKISTIGGGYTIEAIYANKSSLTNKLLKVKGKVVKVNENIMGVNWIHIQDGTGKEGSHDLLITSEAAAKVGQTILAEGKLITDKDFGSGYFYKVLLENARITIE